MTESSSDFLPPLHALVPWLLGALLLLLLGLTCLIVAFRFRRTLPHRVRWVLLIVGAALILGVLLL